MNKLCFSKQYLTFLSIGLILAIVLWVSLSLGKIKNISSNPKASSNPVFFTKIFAKDLDQYIETTDRFSVYIQKKEDCWGQTFFKPGDNDGDYYYENVTPRITDSLTSCKEGIDYPCFVVSFPKVNTTGRATEIFKGVCRLGESTVFKKEPVLNLATWCNQNKGSLCNGNWLSGGVFNMCDELSPAYFKISTMEQIDALHQNRSVSSEMQQYVNQNGYGYRDTVCCNKPCEMNLHACEKCFIVLFLIVLMRAMIKTSVVKHVVIMSIRVQG